MMKKVIFQEKGKFIRTSQWPTGLWDFGPFVSDKAHATQLVNPQHSGRQNITMVREDVTRKMSWLLHDDNASAHNVISSRSFPTNHNITSQHYQTQSTHLT